MLKLFLAVSLILGFSCSDALERREVRSDHPHPVSKQNPPSTDRNILAVKDPSTQVPVVMDLCHKGDPQICEIEIEISRLTNEFRTQQGITAKLNHDGRLSFGAREWSKVMASTQSIGHDGFPKQRNQSIAAEFGNLKIFLAGENVAMTSVYKATHLQIAKIFVDMWIKSPGHRGNMLEKGRNCIGVGVAKNSRGLYYATQIFARCDE